MISAKISVFLLFGLCFYSTSSTKAQSYISKNLKISIFSSTPIEDIRAVSNSATGVLVSQKQELAVQMQIKTLAFDNKMMQEHFNENYMESDTYPLAKFKGVIQQPIDFKKDGIYNVSVKGVLNMHGVDQARTISGTLAVKNGAVVLQSSFDVACADHQIKIPSVVFSKIAEVIKVNFQGSLNLIKN